MEPVPLPPPYGGINQDIPIIAVQSPQCENLFNFNANESGVSLRHGDSKFCSFSTSVPADDGYMYNFVSYKDTTLLAVLKNIATGGTQVYDVETGTLLYNPGTLNNVGYINFAFRNYQFFISQDPVTPGGFSYDGAAFAALGYTATSPIVSYGGCAYKNRAYIIKKNTAAYWYSGVDLIAGALTEVDLSSVLNSTATLSTITTITLADNISAVTLLAFVFNNGEVLFYSGAYPDDISSWQLVGKASIGKPISLTDSAVPYQGDCLIMCVDSIYSLRDLFLKGSEKAVSLSLSDNIKTAWKSATAAAESLAVLIPAAAPCHGVFDYMNERLIFKFNQYYENDTSVLTTPTALFFIYNTSLQSWYIHRSTGVEVGNRVNWIPSFGLTYFKRKVVYTVLTYHVSADLFMVWLKEGATGFQDQNAIDSANVSYPYEITSAALANGRNYVQRASGMDVIIESDMYPQTEYKFIRDLGVQETTAQLIPTQASTLQKPTVNMGIEGSFIQYKISGTTAASKTVGYNLYGTNIWIENGSRPR